MGLMDTNPTPTLDDLRNAREALRPYEGRYLGKMNEEDMRQIRDIVDRYGLMPQHVQGQSKAGSPMIKLHHLYEDLARMEEKEQRRTELVDGPEIAEYAALLTRMGELEAALRERYPAITDPAGEAVRVGLLRGRVQWYST